MDRLDQAMERTPTDFNEQATTFFQRVLVGTQAHCVMVCYEMSDPGHVAMKIAISGGLDEATHALAMALNVLNEQRRTGSGPLTTYPDVVDRRTH